MEGIVYAHPCAVCFKAFREENKDYCPYLKKPCTIDKREVARMERAIKVLPRKVRIEMRKKLVANDVYHII